MSKGFVVAFLTLALLAGIAIVSTPPSALQMDPDTARRLQELRNLGKAMYENPGTQTQAVGVLRQALELNPGSAQEHLNYGLSLLRAGQGEEGIAEVENAQKIDPSLPHTYFNLGIEFKKRNEVERAIRELEQMAKMIPDEPKTHYNLGVLYKLQDEIDRAVAEFELTAELDPSLAAPHFQLYNTLRRIDMDRALGHLDQFKEIKELTEGSATGEDVNWSFYSELHDPVKPAPPAEEAASIEFKAEASGIDLAEKPLGLALSDFDGDGKPDVLAWSSSRIAYSIENAPEHGEEGQEIRHVAVADSDNDGTADLCLVRAGDVLVVDLTFDEGRLSGNPHTVAPGDFNACLWVDYDHDYDLDLLLVGQEQALVRNNGDGSFSDVTASFPFEKGSEALAAASLELWENNSFNIVVAYTDKVVFYEDRKVGQFRAATIAGVTPGEGPVRLEVVDVNHDGFLDIALNRGSGSEQSTQVLRNHEGVLQAGASTPGVLAWADLQNRGRTDAVTSGGVLLSRGGDDQGRLDLESAQAAGLPNGLEFAAAADFDSDGKVDIAAVDASGGVQILLNKTSTSNSYAGITLKGVKNNILTEGARVEVKAGRVYRKQVYQGIPLAFGLGAATTIDTVRITWPNGLIQNESEQPVNQAISVDEKPRLSGSCPMIYTWNGEEFEFISEVLGVAPLGAGLGGGQFFPVDHDEYVWIDGERLKPRDGSYEVRITEELREVAYLDQIKLLAVDHPREVDVFSNEKFKAPPFPEFRLHEVDERRYPLRALDEHGHDVLDRVAKRDGRYVDDFPRDFASRAKNHSLTLDFAGLGQDAQDADFAQDDMVLFLSGWVDWADASRIVAGSQTESDQLQLPYLQVKDENGEWVTVIEDMGLPAGGPRTIAVDLAGKFLSDSREVRIATNLCLYWDEVFAAPKQEAGQSIITALLPETASLSFRGFSRVVLHPERKQPERFHYASVSPTTMWNPTRGNYTRYGPVRELLSSIDDRFVILGAGDEMTLRFPAPALPALPRGWKRDFLLFVDGWAKEAEANTAFGDTVEPLPFHSMSGYPYRADEHYPDTDPHRAYLRKYNVRPALKLIRPLRQ